MRLLKSFSFRLAAIYALLFSISLVLVLGTYQLVSITWPRAEVRKALQAESDWFAEAYRGDRRALALRLEARAGAAAPRAGFHLLADPQGRVVSTNLPSWPAYSGPAWHSIEADIYRDGDEDDHEALAIDRRLPDGTRLMMGRDVEELDDLEEAIAAAALYLLGATLILATLGALLMNWAIGRRLAAVTGAARRVMQGDLAGRVPLGGSGDEFDRLAATLNLMLDRVEAGVEAVRTASDSVAHELRTPLTRLQASLGRLATDGGEPEALEEALAEADRLQALFDAVLRISRIESGRHEARFGPVDLAELIADVAELYGPAAEEKGIVLCCETAGGATIAGDRDLLFQAAANLVDNSIKFTPAGGRVAIALSMDESAVRIEVTDTGPGVPETLLGRMGDRFFRAPAAAETPGFGLGLSLVAAIARVHGGALDFRPGGPGLTSRISFPFSP